MTFMAGMIPNVPLLGLLDLLLPDGSAVRVRPGPYGKGIAVVQVRPHASSDNLSGDGRPGRKPRASTVKLREKLRADKEKGALQSNPYYVRWLLGIDPTVSLAVARQTVYRERKRVEGPD